MTRAALAIAGACVAALARPSWGQAGAGSGPLGGADPRAGARVLKLPLDLAAPSVSAAASPTVVRLGAHFTLYVTATFAAGVEVNLREPVSLGPAFEVRRRLSEDRPAGAGRTTREWQLDVMAWELGELPIAPIAITFTAFGRAGQLQTNAVPMKIIGELGDVVDDPRAVRPLARPAGLWTRDGRWIWIATALGAAAGVVVIARWLGRRRRRRARPVPAGGFAPPARADMTGERALEQLRALERSGVLDRDADRKAGYAEMVEVIRAYLAQRYRIAIHDRTSSELIERLESVAWADDRAGLRGVAAWLAGCDLVKYGGARGSSAEAGKALGEARALVVATAPGRPGERRTEAA